MKAIFSKGRARRRWCQVCLGVGIALTGIAPASAQTSNVVAIARARWDDGMAALKRGDLQAALADLEAVYELLPDPEFAQGLGIVECRAHRYAAAELHLKIALEKVNLSEDQREAARECLEKAHNPVGMLLLDADTDGAVVSIDGEVVGRLPLAAWWLDAGEHILRVEKEGFRETRKFKIEPRTTARVMLRLRRTPPPPARLHPRRPMTRESDRNLVAAGASGRGTG